MWQGPLLLATKNQVTVTLLTQNELADVRLQS